MNRVRFYTAIILARLIYLAIKILNKSSGTSFVGMMTLKFCPNFLAYCRDYVKCAVSVTGTNGKTTTSGILAHILEAKSKKLIHNVKGANMLTGIANVFALNLPKHFDYAVLESDEAYLQKFYDYFKTDYLVVTNLFRDQLDRYGELATTAGFIKKAIDKNERLTLLLNADDPLVTNLGKDKNALYYGFEDVEICSDTHKTDSGAPTEAFNCVCSEPLKYSKQFFAQQGHYYCPKCGYKRPNPDFNAKVKIYSDHSELQITYNEHKYEFCVNLIGLYNAYNALAAIAQAILLGINEDIIKESLLTYKSIFGRTERRIINGHDTLIQLIKNPTGASEVLKTVDLNSNIIIAINDNYADGRDISWLWDSDFEQLKEAQKQIITSGTRAWDMALRLKYAGIPQERITVEPNIANAIKLASENNTDEKITILPSYTALLKINKLKLK